MITSDDENRDATVTINEPARTTLDKGKGRAMEVNRLPVSEADALALLLKIHVQLASYE